MDIPKGYLAWTPRFARRIILAYATPETLDVVIRTLMRIMIFEFG
jgi:hypothetical protein